MEAGKRTVSDIFNGGKTLEIPFFQRDYVWGEDEWDRFIDDMEMVSEKKRDYFLGSILLKQLPTQADENDGDNRLVIDGQQRLTTLVIFCKVLTLFNESNGVSEAGNSVFKQRFTKLRDREIALSHNHINRASFEKVVTWESLKEIDPKDKKIKNDKILLAYNFFKECLQEKECFAILDLFTILNRIFFVVIDLGSNEDEQVIFETLNSLGVDLTTAELLKNYLFSQNAIEKYEKQWKSVFESDTDTKKYWDTKIIAGRFRRPLIDLFLYAYLQIKIQDKTLNVLQNHKEEFARVERLFHSYKEAIKKYKLDQDKIIAEIKEYAIIFKDHIVTDTEIKEKSLTNQFGIERINAIIFALDTTTILPYVLYILKNVQDDTKRSEIFGILECYIIRRMIAKETSKNYNLFFTGMIHKKILSKEELQKHIKEQANPTNYMPDDAEIKKAFQTNKLTNNQAAGILYLMESRIRNIDKQATQLHGISHYSLEHLMPKKWEQNWGKIGDSEKRAERNRLLLTLGNLAIISRKLNPSISNAVWKTKKDGLREYAAGIETLAKYLKCEKWDEAEIQKRAEWLTAHALAIWKA